MKKGMKAQSQSGAKKPYRRPELHKHGDIRSLTQAKKGKRTDGAGKPKTKTTGSV